MAEGKERTTAIKAHGQHFAENIFSSPRKLIGQCKLFKHYYAPGAKVRPRTDVSIIWWHPSTQITKHNTPQHNRRGPKPLFLTWFVQNHYFSSVFGTFWPDLSQTIIFNTFLAHFGHFGGWYGNTHARKHTRTRTWDATKLKKTRPAAAKKDRPAPFLKQRGGPMEHIQLPPPSPGWLSKNPENPCTFH